MMEAIVAGGQTTAQVLEGVREALCALSQTWLERGTVPPGELILYVQPGDATLANALEAKDGCVTIRLKLLAGGA